MQNIRPISDLRNKFTEISRDVHETGRPIFLTKNGYGNMVVMSKARYDQTFDRAEVSRLVQLAEAEAKTTTKRYTHDEMLDMMHGALDE